MTADKYYLLDVNAQIECDLNTEIDVEESGEEQGRKKEKFQVQSFKTFLNAPVTYTNDSMSIHNEIKRRIRYAPGKYNATKRIKQSASTLKIDFHAWGRWNRRVGPKISHNDLENLLNLLYLEPDRIMLISNDVGMIDNEIVFTYYISKNVLIITTFYGRASLQPALMNLEGLKNFNAKWCDRLGLSMSDVILDEQKLPLLPTESMVLGRENQLYKLEKYIVKQRLNITDLTMQGNVGDNTYFINSIQITTTKLYLIGLESNTYRPTVVEVDETISEALGIGKHLRQAMRDMGLTPVRDTLF